MVDPIAFFDQFSSWQIILIILFILTIEVFLISFPKEIVLIYAGLKFGIIYGGIINFLGLIGAAWLGFEGGYSGRFGLEKKRDYQLMQKYQSWLNVNGLKALFLLRIFPFTPNDILSISAGFSKLKKLPYLIITSITAIPYAFFFAYIGDQQIENLIKLFPQTFDPVTWLSSVIIVFILGYYIIKKSSTIKQSEISSQIAS